MRSLIGAGLWWRTWNYCGPLGGGNTGTWCWKWPKKAHSLYKALRIDATAQAFLAEALAMTQLWHGATCGFWVWLWRKEVGSALVTEDMEEGSLVDFLQGQSLLMLPETVYSSSQWMSSRSWNIWKATTSGLRPVFPQFASVLELSGQWQQLQPHQGSL